MSFWRDVGRFLRRNAFKDKQYTRAEDLTAYLPELHDEDDHRCRVLLQVDNFLQGGMENVVLEIAKVLSEHAFDVSILILGKEGDAATLARKAGFNVVRLTTDNKRAEYDALLRQENFALVNAHYSVFGADIAAAQGVPFVQTMHSAYLWLNRKGIVRFQQADPFTKAYICVSRAVAAYADLRMGLSPSKMLICPNGIDTVSLDVAMAAPTREQDRQAYGLAPDDFVLLCTATISEIKAQKFLVQALGRVSAQLPSVKLVLVGKGTDESTGDAYCQAVQSEIKRLGLGGRVLLLGHQPSPYRFYQMADAFVLPSFVEGWSLALAEALYSGLPVIATDVGVAGELLKQTRGELLPAVCGLAWRVGPRRFRRIVRREEYRSVLVDALVGGIVRIVCNPQETQMNAELRTRLDGRFAYAMYGRLFRWWIRK